MGSTRAKRSGCWVTGASALDSVVLHEVQSRESSNMAESVNFESDHESQHWMNLLKMKSRSMKAPLRKLLEPEQILVLPERQTSLESEKSSQTQWERIEAHVEAKIHPK